MSPIRKARKRLDGKKTYLLSTAGGLVAAMLAFDQACPVLTDEWRKGLTNALAALAFGAFSTVRMAIAKKTR